MQVFMFIYFCICFISIYLLFTHLVAMSLVWLLYWDVKTENSFSFFFLFFFTHSLYLYISEWCYSKTCVYEYVCFGLYVSYVQYVCKDVLLVFFLIMLLKHPPSERAENKPVVKISMTMLKKNSTSCADNCRWEQYCSKHGWTASKISSPCVLVSLFLVSLYRLHLYLLKI